jgi:hypothetical protein
MLRLGLAWKPRLRLGLSELGLEKIWSPSRGPSSDWAQARPGPEPRLTLGLLILVVTQYNGAFVSHRCRVNGWLRWALGGGWRRWASRGNGQTWGWKESVSMGACLCIMLQTRSFCFHSYPLVGEHRLLKINGIRKFGGRTFDARSMWPINGIRHIQTSALKNFLPYGLYILRLQ